MSVLGTISQKDKGTGLVLPNLQNPPDSTGFFQNVGAGFTQAVAGPHSTKNAKAIYESRHYDNIIQALKAEGEQATDMVESPVKVTSPFYNHVEGEQVQPDGRVLIPVKRPFTNPFSEGPSITRDVNPIGNFYEGGDSKEIGQIFDAVNRVRARKGPGFLKDYTDPTAVDALALKQRQADEVRSATVTSRATTLGKVGSFIGGMAGSITSGDPENFAGGWAGAPGKSIARTVLNRAVAGAATNTAAGVVAVPGQATDAEGMGQPMTSGDMLHSVGQNALAGAILGTAHAVVPHIPSAVASVTGKAFDTVAPHIPDAVRDPILAASIRAGTVKDRSLLTEFQRLHSPYAAVDTSTPTEKAAAHVVTRDVETQEQSPLQPNAVPAHNNRLSAVAQALGVDLAPPDMPTTAPVQTPTVKGEPTSFVDGINRAEGSTRNPHSTADGYGNFLEKTWLDVAPKVTDTKGLSRDQILQLRHDKTIAARATDYYAAQNSRYLRVRGLEDSPGNLSLAHFLGAGDAAKVLKADPSTPVESLLKPAVIAANEKVLRGKSADQVIAWAHKRIGATVDHPPARPDAVPDEGYDPTSPLPYTVENLKPEELPPTSAQVPVDEPFNHVLSQHLLVWENNAGDRSIIDGGKRLAHARAQDDQSVTLPTVVLREKDGVSEEMALLVGKLKNVNLGTVPLEEAAGTLADIPEVAAALRNPQFHREIAAIAQLPYDKFGAVVNGRVDPVAAAQSPNKVVAKFVRPKGSKIDPQTVAADDALADRVYQNALKLFHREAATIPEGPKRDLILEGMWDEKLNVAAEAAAQGRALPNDTPEAPPPPPEMTRSVPFRSETTVTINGKKRTLVIEHPSGAPLTEQQHGTTFAGTAPDSGGNGKSPSGEGRRFPPEAPHENLPHGSEPSLFDRAVAARDAAEPFFDPVSPEAKQQADLLEHDLRADAGMPRETPPETPEGATPKPPEKDAPVEEPVHLFDLPDTKFRISEEGEPVSLKQALTEAESDEAAAKALRDCL